MELKRERAKKISLGKGEGERHRCAPERACLGKEGGGERCRYERERGRAVEST